MSTKVLLIALCCTQLCVAFAQKPLTKIRSVSAMKGVGSLAFFAGADDVHGEELWVSDGSTEGTRLLRDINPGYAPSLPKEMTAFQGKLFFSAYTAEFERELWTSDGTGEGTVMVKDIAPPNAYYGGSNPTSLTLFKDQLYFTTAQGQLFRSDGTGPGTVAIDEVENGVINNITVAGGYLHYYKGGDEIIRTDGTSTSSIPVPQDAEDTYFYGLHGAGANLFAIRGSTYYQLIKFYAFDPLAGSWTLLKIYQAPLYGDQAIGNFTAIGDRLFFSFRSDYDNVPNADELWVTDGTVDGTLMLKSFGWDRHLANSEMNNFIAYDGNLYFRSSKSSAHALWRSDGTPAGTQKVHDAIITANDYLPTPPVVSGGKLWFGGDIGPYTSDPELWNTDGTTGGTQRYANLDPVSGSFPYLLTDVNGIVYFATGNSNTGTTVWNSIAAPEIDVLGKYNSQVVSRGTISLNQVPVEGCVNVEVKIQNTGYKELIISKIQVTGSTFYLSGQIPDLIPPGETVAFQVYFHPLTRTKQEAELTIFSNDANEPRFSIHLLGEPLPSDTRGLCTAFGPDFVKELIPSAGTQAIALSNTVVPEHSPAPYPVGTLSFPGFSGAVTYTLVPGIGDDNNELFFITGNQLQASQSFDFETKSVYVVRVKATTAESSQEAYFVITVVDTPAEIGDAPCLDGLDRMGYGLTDIAVNGQGHLFVITNHGAILRSTNDGTSWEPLTTGRWGKLNRIIFHESTGYISGDNVLLKSEDQGSTWFQVYLPFAGGPKYYYSISFLDALRGFVANNNGELLYTADGGTTWEHRLQDRYSEIHKPWFWDSSRGIALKDRSGLVKSSDGGVTWENIDVSSLGWYPQWTSLYFLDSENGFLSSYEKLFRTRDGGDTWELVNEVSGNYITGIEFISDQVGYVYGGQYGPLFYRTANGGETWELDFENHGPGEITGLVKSPSGKLFSSHTTYHTNSFYAGRAINYSTDDGVSWQLLQALPDENFYRIDFVSENVGYVYGEAGSFKTEDKGVTWNPLQWSRPIYSTYFFDENNALLSDGFVIYKTSDAGETMEEVFVTDQDPNNYVPVGRLYGINEDLIFSYSTYALYRSLDGGAHWDLMNTDQTAYVQDMQFLSPAVGYRLGLFGHVLKTTDGGVNWTEIFTPDPNAYRPYHTIFFVDETIGYKGGTVFEKTTDGGVTWSTLFTNFYSETWKLHFTDDLHGYASGRTRILYETFDGGLTWSEKWHGDSSDQLYDVQYKHGNIYFAGEKGFVAQWNHPGTAPVQPGYVYGPNLVCAGDVQVYHLPENYSGTYQWNVSGGSIHDYGSTAFVQFPTPGEYTMTVKNFNACGISTSRSYAVLAVALDHPVIEGPEIITTQAGNVLYTIEDPVADIDYAWNVVGAKSFNPQKGTQTSVTWTPGAQDAAVNVIATDPLSGCRISGERQVTVDIVLGLEDESLAISVYPNPTSGAVRVQTAAAGNVRIRIVDMAGKSYVMQELAPNNESIIPLYHLPAGTYVLEVTEDNGTKKTAKIVKQ